MTSEVVFHTEWLTELERRVKALEAAVRPAPEPDYVTEAVHLVQPAPANEPTDDLREAINDLLNLSARMACKLGADERNAHVSILNRIREAQEATVAPALYDGVTQVKSTMYGPEFECRIPQLKAGMKVHLTVRLPDAE